MSFHQDAGYPGAGVVYHPQLPQVSLPQAVHRAPNAHSSTPGQLDAERGYHPYEIVAEVGRGAYGTVYKARDTRNDGRFVALKEIRILTNSEDGLPMSTIREIAMLKQLENFEHPNIVRLFDVEHSSRSHHEMRLWLAFEYIDQDLDIYMKKCPVPGLGPDRIKDLMYQIMLGVDFLHTNRVVHRDLKPQNILVTSQGKVKLADFGLARVYGFQMALTSVVVTLYYRAPEVLLQDTYCTKVDIWSCACIFAELHTRKPLLKGISEIDQLCKIFELIGLPTESDWPVSISVPRNSFQPFEPQRIEVLVPEIEPLAKDLLEKMLRFSQQTRLCAGQVLKHAYFQDELNHMESDCVMSDSLNSTSSSLFNGPLAGTSFNSSNISASNASFDMSASSHNMSASSITMSGTSALSDNDHYGSSADQDCINLHAEEEDVDTFSP